VAFNDETNHDGRWFNCGWGPRAESAEDIARRLQAMARDLRQVAPAQSPLWPQIEMRAIRPTDPGPVHEMSVEDLGRLIDRRARFDPPQLPAPVGPWGYSLVLGGQPNPDPSLRLGASLWAGGVKPDAGNRCVLHLHLSSPVWRDAETGLAMLRALIRAWSPDWAAALASLKRTDEEERSGVVKRPCRPWLAWRKDGGQSVPYEYIDIGGPAVTQAEFGGQLAIWP